MGLQLPAAGQELRFYTGAKSLNVRRVMKTQSSSVSSSSAFYQRSSDASGGRYHHVAVRSGIYGGATRMRAVRGTVLSKMETEFLYLFKDG